MVNDFAPGQLWVSYEAGSDRIESTLFVVSLSDMFASVNDLFLFCIETREDGRLYEVYWSPVPNQTFFERVA